MDKRESQMKHHTYQVEVNWTSNDGEGTSGYKRYRRDHVIAAAGKPEIAGSSDPAFRGDPSRYNPEELLVASLSCCHMLWYLHLCAVNHVTVVEYRDLPVGTMEERDDGSGAFVRVVLRPQVKVAASRDVVKANEFHSEAHRYCFIANSVNFPVEVVPEISSCQP
jgi:organic hydroperoxide reductase OsmC/OhrA